MQVRRVALGVLLHIDIELATRSASIGDTIPHFHDAAIDRRGQIERIHEGNGLRCARKQASGQRKRTSSAHKMAT